MFLIDIYETYSHNFFIKFMKQLTSDLLSTYFTVEFRLSSLVSLVCTK